ncbi:MAG: 4'-phosphopantetheinyl transferase superfamily protein [Bacteroidota bacterium]|nr:4'-phosphopantetheinyl transferase superfamily protein [Bacteroidota bacterium]
MGVVLKRKEAFNTIIGVWKVEESIEKLRADLILTKGEEAFFQRLNKGKRNLHWLSSRVLLRDILNTKKFIDVKGDEHGKPHLINFDYELSITHSADYAAVIISKKKVGIDIEQIKDVIKKISPKFMNEKELKEVKGKNLIKKLYVYWCTKESIYKLNGKSGLRFREDICLQSFDYNKNGGCITAKIVKKGQERNFKIHYEEFENYMFTYVIDDYCSLI